MTEYPLCELTWLDDGGPAEWFPSPRHEGFPKVSAALPRGFEAYARVTSRPGPLLTRSGIVDPRDVDALLPLLRAMTPSEPWYFLFWPGRGGLPRPIPEPVLQWGGSSYCLYTGPPEAVAAFRPWHQSPTAWWPSSRLWAVGTNLDAAAAYVGGPTAVIAAVLADPALDATEAQIDDDLMVDWLID